MSERRDNTGRGSNGAEAADSCLAASPVLRLTGLDALRGIAALVVLAHHVTALHGFTFAPRGYLAVDFFFMLSGYVMARTYEPMPGNFMMRRLRRIWPLVALGTVMGLSFYPPDKAMLLLIPGLLLIPTRIGSGPYPLNGPTWSVAFELLANLAHQLAFAKLSTRTLMLIAVPLLLFCMAQAVQLGSYNYGHDNATFWLGVPRAMSTYLIGICMFRIFRDRAPVRIAPWLTVLAIPLLTVPALPGGAWVDIAFVALCPIILVGALQFGGRWCTALGAISFPLYATHLPILHLVKDYHWSAGVAAALMVACFIAAVSGPLVRLNRKMAAAKA